jgi:hypothetical protein
VAAELIQIDEPTLRGLQARLQEAQEHDLSLSAEDKQLLLDALMTLAHVQERLNDSDITLHKLRKLLGMVQASEKLKDLASADKDETPSPGSPSRRTARARPAAPPPSSPAVVHHPLQGLQKGDTCPACEIGKLYKFEPARLLRISGSSPLTAVQHICERLRCNACGEYFTAPLPDDVKADGEPQQKYGHSARSVMAIHKYFGGSPFYRQGSLQQLFGMPVSASTVFDQCEAVADAGLPVFNHLKKGAAGATHYQIDDTPHKILDQAPVMKKQRHSDKERLRTGVYCSGMIATLPSGQDIVLFNTDIGHAGEWIDDILRLRPVGLPWPSVMSDALASNHVTVIEVIRTLCNAHGRRQFVDVIAHFPVEVKALLEQYARIWQHETHVEKEKLSRAERLAYHREHSLPVMQYLKSWGEEALTSERVEENSGLGKALRYFNKHFEGLSGFCTHEGAKLDNNDMEQQLKLVARNRKNAHFFKTAVGAAVGDVLTSLIATSARAGINAFDYLNALQCNQVSVKAHPELWMPWNFAKN